MKITQKSSEGLSAQESLGKSNSLKALFREGALQNDSSMSSPSAHEIHPLGNGRVSAQSGEDVGIVDWALNAGTSWKLRIGKPISMDDQPAVHRNRHQPWSLRSS